MWTVWTVLGNSSAWSTLDRISVLLLSAREWWKWKVSWLQEPPLSPSGALGFKVHFPGWINASKVPLHGASMDDRDHPLHLWENQDLPVGVGNFTLWWKRIRAAGQPIWSENSLIKARTLQKKETTVQKGGGPPAVMDKNICLFHPADLGMLRLRAGFSDSTRWNAVSRLTQAVFSTPNVNI